MAKLVAVRRSDDYRFERRQLPLGVDDNLTMVVQFNDSCVGCHQVSVKQKNLETFVQKYHALTKDEVAVGLMVTNREIYTLLSQLVPCVGCRRSVEKLFKELVESGHPALEPLVITRKGELSIKHEFLFDPKAVYALFYIHGTNLSSIMESIPKSKKNKRCVLHSLDTHKTRSLGSWMDVWDVLSKDCREEVVLIECDNLMSTLENYLRKHRFCSECKAKVLRAYNILVGEVNRAGEKGFCPALYEGLDYCSSERHLHVSCETNYIAQLIGRAEPELTGSSRRERHAKTLDIAQEEVLTCLGIHLYERLHRIWQKLRAQEQTWQVLFYLGVDALRKNFELACERKQGISNLELMCQELLQEEQAKELKREQKRQKRKKKKTKQKQSTEVDIDAESELCGEKENCLIAFSILSPAPSQSYVQINLPLTRKCDENTNISTAICASCDNHNSKAIAYNGNCQYKKQVQPMTSLTRDSGTCSRSDCGYSSGHEGCDSCSQPSSNDGSDVACSEGMCNHEGDSPLCHRNEIPDMCHDCLSSGDNCQSPKTRQGHEKHCRGRLDGRIGKSGCGRFGAPGRHKACESGGCDSRCTGCGSDCGGTSGPSKLMLTLEDMLEASCSSGEEEDFISEEEIRHFKANQSKLNTQRQELRETLRQRFANMQQRAACRCEPSKEDNQSKPEKIKVTSVASSISKMSVT